MKKHEFEKWLLDNGFGENDLFNESLVCYNNRAYRAAYMFSYLGYADYIRNQVIEYRGVPVRYEDKMENKTKKKGNELKEYARKEWKKVKERLTNEDNWDEEFKDLINEDIYNIFALDASVRSEFMVKKNHRNVCAHNKNRSITEATVEDLWDFIEYTKPLVIINGTGEMIISMVNDITMFCNESEYEIKAKEIHKLYSAMGEDKRKEYFFKIFKGIGYEFFWDASVDFYIKLMELIFSPKECVEYEWIKELPAVEMIAKLNVCNFDGEIDKIELYKRMLKEDSDKYSYNTYSLAKLFGICKDVKRKKRFLKEIYNRKNHYTIWVSFLLASEDWKSYLDDIEIESFIVAEENIKEVINEIKELYTYKSGTGYVGQTTTFDYCSFGHDKILRKVFLILWLLKGGKISANHDIDDIVCRCKRVISNTRQYGQNSTTISMDQNLRSDAEIYSWLEQML